jgi:hypothetical protein
MDMFSDIYSSEFRHNWKNFGVVRLDLNTNGNGEKLPHSIKYDSEMFKKYGSKNRFFHITSPLNASKILSEGLKCRLHSK